MIKFWHCLYSCGVENDGLFGLIPYGVNGDAIGGLTMFGLITWKLNPIPINPNAQRILFIFFSLYSSIFLIF